MNMRPVIAARAGGAHRVHGTEGKRLSNAGQARVARRASPASAGGPKATIR